MTSQTKTKTEPSCCQCGRGDGPDYPLNGVDLFDCGEHGVVCGHCLADESIDSKTEIKKIEIVACPECKGRGEVFMGPKDMEGKTCPTCNGTGSMNCRPECHQTLKTESGRGWNCNVDQRGSEGCPVCPTCKGTGRDPTLEDLWDALVDMTWQFAIHGKKDGVDVIHSGGLSSLELAFEVLGIPDPCPVDQAKKAFDRKAAMEEAAWGSVPEVPEGEDP